MPTKTSLLALSVVVAVTSAGAAIHGRQTNRWGASQDLVEAGNRVRAIPVEVGQWRFQSSQELSNASQAMLESTGYLARNYTDPTTGALVNVSLIAGPAGTISVHSPEICLPSRDFDLQGTRTPVTIRDSAGVNHQLWKVTFKSRDVNARLLHVYYGWSIGDTWSAPESPRFNFVGAPFLYKIQLSGYASASFDDSEQDLISLFLQDFLPIAGKTLRRNVQNK